MHGDTPHWDQTHEDKRYEDQISKVKVKVGFIVNYILNMCETNKEIEIVFVSDSWCNKYRRITFDTIYK